MTKRSKKHSSTVVTVQVSLLGPNDFLELTNKIVATALRRVQEELQQHETRLADRLREIDPRSPRSR